MNKPVRTNALSDTMWMLMARYKGRPMIPASEVCDDFFQPLTYPKVTVLRKLRAMSFSFAIF
jgi:hypothetical protein